MGPSLRRDPLDDSRGVRPSQLANCRPRLKARMCGTEPTSAVAVITPTPGICWSRCAAGSAPASCRSCRSSARTWSVSTRTSSRTVPSVRRNTLGTTDCGSARAAASAVRPAQPGGKARPCSRSKARSKLMRPVRVCCHCRQTRCSPWIICCSTVLIGTAWIVPHRLASNNASVSDRSVLSRRT